MSNRFRGEHIASFNDPAMSGVVFDVDQYRKEQLVEANPIYHGMYVPLPAAMSLADGLTASFRDEKGVPTAYGEGLALRLAQMPGTFYATWLMDDQEAGMPIVACGYVPHTPTATPRTFKVNYLEVRGNLVGTRTGQFAAAAALHCMIRNQPDKNTARFSLRPPTQERRQHFFELLGLEMAAATRKEAEWSNNPQVAQATIGTVKRNLQQHFNLPPAPPETPISQ